MLTRKQMGVTLLVFALGQFASATLLHEHKIVKVSAAVSKVSGAPAVSAAPVMVTKAEMIKEALGMPGPSTAAVVPAGCQSAFAIASSSPDFTILTQAIKATGLTSLLDNPALVATVFAPTDAAFTSTLDSLDITPQELFDDVVTLTAILKYHVIPGLSLSQGDFRDGQTYPTLLSGKQGPYTVEYASRTVYSLENAKDDPGNFESELAAIVPSGGKPAKITEFDVNAGCPSVINVIDRVLIPDYKEAGFAHLADVAVSSANAYQAATADF